VKTEAVVAVVEAHLGNKAGRGEAVPYARYNETPDSVLSQLALLAQHRPGELTREQLAKLLPPGAARNAVDCALWELEAQLAECSVGDLIGRRLPPNLITSVTISIDTPERMAEATRAVANAQLIKVKVNAEPRAALEAVAHAAPKAKLIVDPNESWNFELLRELQPFLARLPIAFVEQPLPASEDASLADFKPLVPVCADESLHTTSDLEQVARRYQLVNIKLDKTGGLTEALQLLAAARARRLGVMVGCMISTSLSIAPALYVAAEADFVDLDGPWWLEKDRDHGVHINAGLLHTSSPFLWGNQRAP
jgi:L-alanine-DL-glutamate epimerase-like enolase superfamily enzyme